MTVLLVIQIIDIKNLCFLFFECQKNMGVFISFPHIHHLDYPRVSASDILDEEIASHLQEIGAGPAIPFRKEKPKTLDVPVCLNSPIFQKTNDGNLQISFSTAQNGEFIVSLSDFIEFDIPQNKNETNQNDMILISSTFPSALDQICTFPSPKKDFDVSFYFDVENGVSMRRFHFQVKEKGEPQLTEDAIICDGKIYNISKIYGQDEDSQITEGMCLICYSDTANVLALPCRHCSMCSKCGKRFATLSSKCPICRQVVTELIEIDN